MKKSCLFLTILLLTAFCAVVKLPAQPPAVRNGFSRLTSYEELSEYVRSLPSISELVQTEVLGSTVKGHDLFVLKFSSGKFGEDASKVRVLIFAQQHGNEQSGKEGALLLAAELLKPENRYLFDRIDLALVPQVNPDGLEVNRRRNGNGMDLNRNHVILTEPETQALHRLFDRYLFEVTLDVHEYSPYGESWLKSGYRKNSEVTLGATTNLNVSRDIRVLSDSGYLPFALNFIRQRGFSSFTYCPGGPPGETYIRHSTFDVNDGRQSLGIQNTFSFIQEGMNGKDDSTERLQRRAEGQLASMLGLLGYVYRNPSRILETVQSGRKILQNPPAGETISVQSEHVPDGTILILPVATVPGELDSVIQVTDYRPVLRSLLDVEKPYGYLIPADCTLLVDWAQRQEFRQEPWKSDSRLRIEAYHITALDSIDFEGDRIVDPKTEIMVLEEPPKDPEWIFIPAAQLKGNLLTLAVEPKSMTGLATYRQFADLLKPGTLFPILRVIKKKP